MPRINVRDVPRPLHALLKRRAKDNHRSLNKEVLAILEGAVDVQKADRDAAIEEINRMREEGPTIYDEPDEVKRKMREGAM